VASDDHVVTEAAHRATQAVAELIAASEARMQRLEERCRSLAAELEQARQQRDAALRENARLRNAGASPERTAGQDLALETLDSLAAAGRAEDWLTASTVASEWLDPTPRPSVATVSNYLKALHAEGVLERARVVGAWGYRRRPSESLG
jgi:hypothetical protein